MKSSEVKRYKLEWYDPWQQANHAKICSDQPQTKETEPFITSVLSRETLISASALTPAEKVKSGLEEEKKSEVDCTERQK